MALSAQDLAAFHAVSLPQASAPTVPQGKGNFLTHLLPSIGGTAGGIGGGALLGGEIGTALLPGIGTAGGALLGALLGGATGGAAGKVAENKIEGNAMGNGVVGAGIENGILSAGPLRLLKGAGAVTKAGSEGLLGALAKPVMAHGTEDVAQTALKTSVAGKLENFGNNQLAKQWGTIDTITKKATAPGKTIPQLADMGLVKPQDVERVAGEFTGTNGLVNQAVIKAVGHGAPVETSGIPGALEESIVGNNLHGLPQAETVKALVKSQLEKLGQNPTTSETLSSMKRLEKQIADLEGAGGNAKRTDPTRGDMANVYRDVRDHMQGLIDKSVSDSDSISKVLTSQLRQQLVDLHPNNPQWLRYVEDKVMNAKNIGQLRHSQAPLVNGSKMIENAADNAVTMGGRTGNLANNLHGGGSVKGAIAATVANIVKDPAARIVGTTARNISSGTVDKAGLAAALAGPSAKQIIRNEALLGVPLNSIPDANAQGDPNADPNTVHYEDGTTATIDPTTGQPITTGAAGTSGASTAPTSLTSALSATAPASNSPFDAANVPGNIQKLLQSGGTMKDVTAYLDMAKTVQEMQAASAPAQPKALNSTQQQQSFNAQSGLTSLQDIAAALQKNPNEAKLAALPGGGLTASLTGTGSYKAAIANASDVIGRLRSGGAIGQQEEKQFKALLPQTFDTPQTAAYKLNQLQTLFAQFANPQAATADPSQLTAGAY